MESMGRQAFFFILHYFLAYFDIFHGEKQGILKEEKKLHRDFCK
jgi:hypothetical protein